MSQVEQMWQPPLTFEEKLKAVFVPPRLYIKYRVSKELRKGEAELKMLPFLAPADRVALDIGANKGVWSYMLAKQCREVHAFEPNPKMFNILKRCAGANVKAHAIALSNESKQSRLRIPKGAKGYSNQGASLSAVKVCGEYAELNIDARRLDDMDVGDVGFMKIDVEGFELQVLEGARETLTRYKPNLVIEMEERHTGCSMTEMIETVCAYGYQAFALNGGVLCQFERAWAGGQLDQHGRYLNNFIFLPEV